MTHDSTPRNRIRTAAREPLVHFLLIGAAIYGLFGLNRPDVEEVAENRITVTAGEIEWLTGTWQQRWNRAPTPQERSRLIDQYVRETIFYREAIAMGLDRDDTIIRRRLAQKLEFLSEDLVATVAPTDEQLRAYFAEHIDQYEFPELLTMTYVFVDPDKREEQTLADAEAIGADLLALQPPTEGAEDIGDPFMLEHHYPECSETALAKLFGAEFAPACSSWSPISGTGRCSRATAYTGCSSRSASPPEFRSSRRCATASSGIGATSGSRSSTTNSTRSCARVTKSWSKTTRRATISAKL